MDWSVDHPAVATRRSFLEAMYDWGAKMIEYSRSLQGREVEEDEIAVARAGQRKEIEAIFREYCEVGAKAKRLRDRGLAFDSDSPEYDLANELITSVAETGRVVVVETKQTNKLRWLFRYELVPVGDSWKIRDKKMTRSHKDPTWRPDML